jgi:hypothetical protein
MRRVFLVSASRADTVAATRLILAPVLWSLVVIVPLILRGGGDDLMQTRQAVRRNFPLIGHSGNC